MKQRKNKQLPNHLFLHRNSGVTRVGVKRCGRPNSWCHPSSWTYSYTRSL